MLAAFILVACGAAFFFYAGVRREWLRHKAGLILGAWASGSQAEGRFSANFTPVPGIPGVAAAITAGDIIYHCAKMDPQVLDALELRAAPHPDNMWEVHNYITERLESGASVDGMAEYWKGITGEVIVAEKLQEAGHIVEFAESPTQEGYDLIVDGTPLQVKTGGAAIVSEHFAKYPDIPVVASIEADGVPGDVEIPDGFEAAEVKEQVADTIDGAAGLTSWYPGIPVVTGVISGVRNYKKLEAGLITSGEALKFTVQDTLCVGGGSGLGAKAGTALGACLGLPGMIVGGLAGGILGAMVGRVAARIFRGGRLRELVKQFETDMTWFAGVFSSSADLIISNLTRGASSVLGHARTRSYQRSVWEMFKRFVWPSVDDFVADDMTARARREVKTATRKVRALMQKLQGLGPADAFMLLANNRAYISLAGLEDKFEPIVTLTTEIHRERQRVR